MRGSTRDSNLARLMVWATWTGPSGPPEMNGRLMSVCLADDSSIGRRGAPTRILRERRLGAVSVDPLQSEGGLPPPSCSLFSFRKQLPQKWGERGARGGALTIGGDGRVGNRGLPHGINFIVASLSANGADHTFCLPRQRNRIFPGGPPP